MTLGQAIVFSVVDGFGSAGWAPSLSCLVLGGGFRSVRRGEGEGRGGEEM